MWFGVPVVFLYSELACVKAINNNKQQKKRLVIKDDSQIGKPEFSEELNESRWAGAGGHAIFAVRVLGKLKAQLRR